MSDMNPDMLQPYNLDNVSRLKLRDVKSLLTTHFGNNWPENDRLLYFKTLLDKALEAATVPQEEFLSTPTKEVEDDTLKVYNLCIYLHHGK